MMETCVGPSELHLKKELTSLRKSRFLRDPETSSSWRSPLSSRAVATAAYSIKYENGTKRNDTLKNSGIPDVGCDPNLSMNENRQKKVYLFNWGNHSRKSSDGGGIKLDENSRQEYAEACVEDNLHIDRRSDENHIHNEVPAAHLSTREVASGSRVTRPSRKQRRRATSKQLAAKNSTILKLLDLPPSSLSFLNSLAQHEDTEYSNSEGLQCSTRESNGKSGGASQVASPLFSASGCGNWSDSSKILKHARKEGSSYSHTPASTSSYNRHRDRNASTVESWDGTGGFGDVEANCMDLSGHRGCGIPCYSSKRQKYKGSGGWYSPSLSDTLRRGSSILCGSNSVNHRRSSAIRKRRAVPKSSHGLPLLHNSYEQRGPSTDSETDEGSAKYGEIDLEAISRLDGSRWSNCQVQECFNTEVTSASASVQPDPRSLSQKYRPKIFQEIIGQNIVVQSLMNAILRRRISPAYIFQGPRGTGKTCVARIFAAALNCLSTEKEKPCGYCKECSNFVSGNGSNVKEVDAINVKAIDRLKYLLKNLPSPSSFSRYKVFVIDDCHMLSSKTWSTFMKFLEDPFPRVVFIFITIDPDSLPRSVVSRCQRYVFPKVKDSDIISRIRGISSKEGLDIEPDALDLIALNSNGSLRDAETMLEQLSLLGKRITSTLVHDLVGLVPDEKLLNLLEIAMSADTAETVRKSRELLDSGIDPTRLMSQLAGLIMDIIAGTHQLACSKSDSALGGRRMTEAELDKLQQGLKVLSDAEKQLRHSSERSTWFTAALLQLGSGPTFESMHSSGSSSKRSSRSLITGHIEAGKEALQYPKSDAHKRQHGDLTSVRRLASGHLSPIANTSSGISMRQNPTFDSLSDSLKSKKDDDNIEILKNLGLNNLDDIWRRCIQGCHSITLRNLLSSNAKLVSLTEIDGVLITNIAFKDSGLKSRAERFISSITNSMELILRHTVEIQMGLLTDFHLKDIPDQSEAEPSRLDNVEPIVEPSKLSSPVDPCTHITATARNSVEYITNVPQSSREQDKTLQSELPAFSLKQDRVCNSSDRKEGALSKMEHRMASEEQRLESAWLQTADRGAFLSANTSKLESNRILPRNGFSHSNNYRSVASWALAFDSKRWEDELNQEIKSMRIGGRADMKEEMMRRVDRFSISPSGLHSNVNRQIFDGESPDHDSGPGCGELLCWRTNQSRKKQTRETRLVSKKPGRISCFGRVKSKKSAEKKIPKVGLEMTSAA